MSRKLLAIALFLALSLCATAQTTVSGNLKTILGENLQEDARVEFRLSGHRGGAVYVAGTGPIVDYDKPLYPDANGLISGSVYSNSSITPTGTFYIMEFWHGGQMKFTTRCTISGTSFNINNLSSCTVAAATALTPDKAIVSYIHNQVSAATTWTITHNFASADAVCTFFDSASQPQQLFPDTVKLTDNNTMTATFTVAQAGKAICIKTTNFTLASGVNQVISAIPTSNQTIANGFNLTLDGKFYAPNINNVRHACEFTGADAGAKIAAAITDLPSTGGTVDARCFEGAQTISANPFAGVTKSFTLLLGAATFTSVEWVLPGDLKVSIIGLGGDKTVLIPTATNQRLIRCENYLSVATPRCDDTRIKGITIKAHASGSTAEAVNLSGFRFGEFEFNLLTNGTGSFTRWIDLNAKNLCYGNRVRVVMHGQANVSGTVVAFTGNGVDADANANANEIHNVWIVSNTGTFTAVDTVLSANVTIRNGLIEDNASATAIKPGTNTTIAGMWLEANGTHIAPTQVTGGASNGVQMLGNYISAGATINLTGFEDWFASGNYPNGGLAFTNGTNNVVHEGAEVRNQLLLSAGAKLPNLTMVSFTKFSAGADSSIDHDTTDRLRIIGGSVGGRILNNAASANLIFWDDTGNWFPQASGQDLGTSSARWDLFSGVISSGADPAEAGAIRMSNAESIQFEASPAGTDVNALEVDASEVVHVGKTGASAVQIGAAPLAYRTPQALAASTTPSVAAGNVFTTASTASITDFTGGVAGQVIILLCGADTTTSLVDSTPIFISAAFTCTSNDTITLVYSGSVWYEIARAVN